MTIKVACAPCCWGIEESDAAENTSWGKVLVEAREAGYQGIELGPAGYFPSDPALLKSAFRIRGIQLCAGKLHEAFSNPAEKERVLEKANQVIGLLAELGADKLLIMDKANSIRDAYIGHSAIAPRLSGEQQKAMVALMSEVAAMAAAKGIRALLHPSSGGYVAFPDEIEAVLYNIPNELLGLCLDVGHLYIDGMKPDEYIRRYCQRLEHLHVKDIDGQRLRKALHDRCGISHAYAKGLTRPLGQGDVNYSKIFRALEEIDYDGWLVVEQERPVSQAVNVKADLARSREYLARQGV